MTNTTRKKSDEKELVKITKETTGKRFSWNPGSIKIVGGNNGVQTRK